MRSPHRCRSRYPTLSIKPQLEPLEERTVLSAALDLVGVTAMRNDPAFAGIDGSGFSVAIIDTGVDFSHTLLAPAFVAARDFVTGTNGVTFTDPHGTHVAGIVGARDPNIGIATGVSLIGLQVFVQSGDRVVAPTQYTEQALRWVLDNRQTYNIIAVNMSLGAGFFTDAASAAFSSPYNDEIDALEAAGVTVVAAAGNSYAQQQFPNSATPGILSTLNVGAVWETNEGTNISIAGATDFTTGPDRVTGFTQRPPLAPNAILAPGALIRSTIPGNRFADFPGTSMASPLVAGAVALVQEAALQFGGRLLTPAEVAQWLIQTADQIFDGDDENDSVQNTQRSYPRINVYNAVRAIRDFFGNIAPPSGDPNGTIAGAVIGPILSGGVPASLSGRIGTDGNATQVGNKDVDIVRFEVQNPGRVVIEVASDPNNPLNFDSYLRLFNSNGVQIATDDDSGEGVFSQLSVDLSVGVYYVGVSGFANTNYNPQVAGSGVAGATGNYVLNFSLTNSDPNGTLAGAVDVQIGNFNDPLFFNGYLGTDLGVATGTDDVDIFRVNLTDRGRILIDTDTPFLGDFADTLIRLFDSNGNEIGRNDDALALGINLAPNEFENFTFPGLHFPDPFDTTFFVGHDTDSFLIQDILQAGTYYIGISHWLNGNYDPRTNAGRGAPTPRGAYHLYVQFINNDQNGSITQAFDASFAPLPSTFRAGIIGADSNLLTGELLDVGTKDVDFLKINSPTPGILEIDVDAFVVPSGIDPATLPPNFLTDLQNDPVDAVIAVWDSSGNLLAFNDDSDFLDPFLRVQIAANTDYFVSFAGYGNDDFNPFQLASGSPGDTGRYLFSTKLLPLSSVSSFVNNRVTDGAIESIQVNRLVEATIGADNGLVLDSDDVDLYRFIPDETGRYSLRLRPPAAFDALTLFRVFNAAGLPIASGDNNLAFQAEQGQTYFIGVSGRNNANYNINNLNNRVDGGSTGNYAFQILALQDKPSNIGVARPNGSGGLVFSLDSNGNRQFDPNQDTVFNFGLVGDIIIVGDWNADTITDIGVARRNSAGGLVFSLDSNGNRRFDPGIDDVFNFGLFGDTIIVGDWDGNGVFDLGVARPNGRGGLVFSLDSNGSRFFEPGIDSVFNFGLAGDRIVVGDWNADARFELGVARPNAFGGLQIALDSNGSRNFEAGIDDVFEFGLAADRLVVGDWDADGDTDFGVARRNPAGGLVFSLDSNGSKSFESVVDEVFNFGLADDILVVGSWSN